MIIPVWKNIGESSHLLAKKTGKHIANKTKNSDDAKATHTGTLDPMAEGVLIVLTGKDRFRKTEFSNNKKEYTFKIVFGVQTDSHDLLGLQTEITNHKIELGEIEKPIQDMLPQFLGEQVQIQPAFSAQRIGGESSFDKAKKGEIIHSQTNTITIFSLELLHSKMIPIDEIHSYIKETVGLVSGDFRQAKVLENWAKTVAQLKRNNITALPIIELKAIVSKRTYIRSLVQDMANALHLPATTYTIIRTQNGNYKKNECEDLPLD